uniref:Uncharacterized protein n=1 Tax=Meloidogyne enterolobii TaxID=390850 RepID=A0A6V7W0X5_MELEN|nr:unnamed protein product [Meloidogyne enterolobii]
MTSTSFFLRFSAILLVFGFVVQCEEVGLGKHVLVNETIIELKNNTRIAENDTDLERYRKLPGACDVNLDNDGNIILWYSKNSNTTEFGCSVDLVTKNEGQILLEFGILDFTNISDCITQQEFISYNMISFSYSMNGSEFEELKNGPKSGSKDNCANYTYCKNEAVGGDCWSTTAFYSIGVMHQIFPRSFLFNYFLQPGNIIFKRSYFLYLVADKPSFLGELSINESSNDASFKLSVRGKEFRYELASKEFFKLETMCYKEEKHRKPEEWMIVDNNYINKNQNFTHLFTFNIMPIKAMRQSLQDFWARCKINETNPGCDKEATLLKCEKMFIRFDKDHFRILVPDDLESSTLGSSTVGSKNLSVSTTQNMDTTSELVDTTTTNSIEVTKSSPTINTKTSPTTDTKMPSATKPSGMSTTTIVFIISGIVVLVFVSIVVVLFCTLFRRKKEENGQSKQEESQYSNPHSTQSTTNMSTTDSNVDVEMPPTATTEEKTEERTEEKQDFNDVDTVENTQGEPSNAKTGVAVPNSFIDMEGIGAKHDNDFSVKSDVTVPDTLISTNTVHEDLVVAEDPIIHNAKSGVEVPDSVNED